MNGTTTNGVHCMPMWKPKNVGNTNMDKLRRKICEKYNITLGKMLKFIKLYETNNSDSSSNGCKHTQTAYYTIINL